MFSMLPRLGIRPVAFLTLVCATLLVRPPSLTAQEDPALRRAREVLREAPLLDTHNDLPWLIREYAGSDVAEYDLRGRAPHETDLERLRQGQVSAQFWSVWIPSVDSGSARMQLEQIDLARRMIEAYPEAFLFATKSTDVEAARRAGKIASFLGGENGRALENSLGTLRAYYALGMRYMTLTHGRGTDWADSATDEAKIGGLSPFGEEVVREMNRLGMLVDISHVSPAVMRDVLDVSEAPVMFSHSSARGLTDHPRNVPDDVLRRLPENGGIVMITFIPAFVSTEVMKWEEPLTAKLQGSTAIADMARIEKEHEAVAGPKPRRRSGTSPTTSSTPRGLPESTTSAWGATSPASRCRRDSRT
jgi:membrane dipeptidase